MVAIFLRRRTVAVDSMVLRFPPAEPLLPSCVFIFYYAGGRTEDPPLRRNISIDSRPGTVFSAKDTSWWGECAGSFRLLLDPVARSR